MEIAIIILSLAIVIMALFVLLVSTDIEEIKNELKKINKPKKQESYTSFDDTRCTCGTEYDIDGIPKRKSCKKHYI